jgi:putative DNA primase/helicase
VDENNDRHEASASIIENRRIIMDENYKQPERSASASNFEVREEGLFETDDAGRENRICDPIWHLGNAVRADGSGASDVLKFLDRKGVQQEVIILHAEAVNHPRKVFDTLADRNFAVPELEPGRDQPLRDQITSYLAESRGSPKLTFLLAHRMGWHGASFVIGHDVISTDASQALKLTGPISQYAEKFGQGGTLDDYKSKVLWRASYSSRLMAGIALALLAPLARILSLENGGLNIVGKAGIGKTTILRVAGSFYGGGPKPYFVPWLMTDNAPETLGFAHCDLPLLLDELDAFETDSGRAGGRLKAIVHRLSVGQCKVKSHRASTDDSMLTDFHVLYGSTSEHRLPDFMRDGGSKMTGGQAARFVDLPADAGQGLKIFESLPQSSKTGRIPDVDKYLQRLNRACESDYGVAGRAYLGYLVHDLANDRSTLEAFLRKAMTTFETEVANDAQVDPRIRRRYAGLYAAGQLGLRYQILHPRCDWFMEAMSSCYRAAISPDATSSLSAAEAAARLAKFLRANRDRLLKRSGERDITRSAYREAIGLRPDQTHGKRTWLKSSVFRDSIFPDATDSALGRLVTAEVILKSKAGLVAQQQRVSGLNIKEYFYVIDSEKLGALNGGNGHS